MFGVKILEREVNPDREQDVVEVARLARPDWPPGHLDIQVC